MSDSQPFKIRGPFWIAWSKSYFAPNIFQHDPTKEGLALTHDIQKVVDFDEYEDALAAASIHANEHKKERLKVAKLREALREAKDFAQDTLARANRAIETDCDKCDYQCEGCIGAIDDCESVKKIIIKTLAETEDKT